MKGILSVLTTFVLSIQSFAAFDFNEATIKLMNDLNAGDTINFLSHFKEDAKLHHVGEDGVESIDLIGFKEVLNKFRTKEYQENFTKIVVTDLETGLVYVDVHFSFYINDVFVFAGIDHVIWVKEANSYKIETLYTGALKPKFTTATSLNTPTAELNMLMNKWHGDVAKFNFDDYFDFMDSGFIFLGTDPNERWTKAEFKEFCQPFFEKQATWDFKTNWRNWYFSEDGQTAWFEESIATWMEECRGSGVLIKKDNRWKISHYNLTVLIENDKIDKFIKLRKK